MNLKKQIPNLLTLANLFCGTIAVIFAVKGDFEAAAILVLIGILFDFLDGFAARLLNAQAELGKQLDSLADMVTSGVVPSIIMYQLLIESINTDAIGYFGTDADAQTKGSLLPYFGLLLALAACYRLAKFNLDVRQLDNFIGLPTPSMAIFVISLPLITIYSDVFWVQKIITNTYFLLLVTVLLSVLMHVNVALFSLKFKSFGFKENKIKYLFLVSSLVLVVLLKLLAIPVIIIFYVLLSVLQNITNKKA